MWMCHCAGVVASALSRTASSLEQSSILVMIELAIAIDSSVAKMPAGLTATP